MRARVATLLSQKADRSPMLVPARSLSQVGRREILLVVHRRARQNSSQRRNKQDQAN
jgi:hypothetical protein